MKDYELGNVFNNLDYKQYSVQKKHNLMIPLLVFGFIIVVYYLLINNGDKIQETYKDEKKNPSTCKTCNNKENLNNLVLRYETENFNEYFNENLNENFN